MSLDPISLVGSVNAGPSPLTCEPSAEILAQLQPRQRRFYRQRGKVYRAQETRDGAGKRTGVTWSAVSGMLCMPFYIQATPSNFMAQDWGLTEEDMIFTLDILHFPLFASVRADDVVQLRVTLDPTGTPAGTLWKLRGNVRPAPVFFNKLAIIGARLEGPPVGLDG